MSNRNCFWLSTGIVFITFSISLNMLNLKCFPISFKIFSSWGISTILKNELWKISFCKLSLDSGSFNNRSTIILTLLSIVNFENFSIDDLSSRKYFLSSNDSFLSFSDWRKPSILVWEENKISKICLDGVLNFLFSPIRYNSKSRSFLSIEPDFVNWYKKSLIKLKAFFFCALFFNSSINKTLRKKEVENFFGSCKESLLINDFSEKIFIKSLINFWVFLSALWDITILFKTNSEVIVESLSSLISEFKNESELICWINFWSFSFKRKPSNFL